jgi:nitrate/nitrite transporter NarK
VCSVALSYTSASLGLTMMVVVFWSLCVPMACGASYGVAPFITRRGLGVATGLIGAGGELLSFLKSFLSLGGACRRPREQSCCCWARFTAPSAGPAPAPALCKLASKASAWGRLTRSAANRVFTPCLDCLSGPLPLPWLSAHPPPQSIVCSAAGNAGSAVTQAIFFTSASMSEQEGYRYMGVMIMAVTLLVTTIHFPMWGGMLTRGEWQQGR